MKKIISIALIFTFIFFVTACGKDGLDASKTKKDSFEQLTYEVPEKFEKSAIDHDDENSDIVFSDYEYRFEKIGSNGKYDDLCSIRFFYTQFDSRYDYTLEKFANIFNNGLTGTKKKINGVDWLIFKDDSEPKMIEYLYYAVYNNKYYEVSYSDWGSDTLCGDVLPTIENSLKFE